MEIKIIDIALLEGNRGQVDGLPANPRKWTQREVERIAASLQETPELLEARPAQPQGESDGDRPALLRYNHQEVGGCNWRFGKKKIKC